jgi:hypothetical protein
MSVGRHRPGNVVHGWSMRATQRSADDVLEKLVGKLRACLPLPGHRRVPPAARPAPGDVLGSVRSLPE